jgi:diguanylate cyclase (GGDEF)-like protein
MGKSAPTDKDERILREQARSSLDNGGLTLLANVVISVSAAVIVLADNRDTFVIYWLITVLLISAVRSRLLAWIRSTDLIERDPRLVMRMLTIAALISGLSWCPIPLLFADVSTSRTGPLIVFITAGITAGAIIQNVASWRIALAFGAPVMITTILRMLQSGDGTGYVAAANVLFFTGMMFRAALMAERNFIASRSIACEATELARSLERANRALEQQARTDPLTGLANRLLFRETADVSCAVGRPVSLIILDVDEFKTINDTWGHRVGDLVLATVADRLRSECGPDELAVRFGGDEFVILMRGPDLERRTPALAETVFRRVSEPVEVDGHRLSCGCSVGVALHVDGVDDVDTLLVQADLALYRSKAEGRARISFFEPQTANAVALRRGHDGAPPRAPEVEPPSAPTTTGVALGFGASTP